MQTHRFWSMALAWEGKQEPALSRKVTPLGGSHTMLV